MRAALLATIGVMVACGSPEPTTSAQPTARPKTPRDSTADAGTSIVTTVSYMYNPVAKRDPFRNMLEENSRGSQGSGEGTAVCAEPLCNFDLDQLTLVAVVSGDANPVGMVEDPSKVGHIIRRNSRVGKQGGKVTQIQRDCVVVTEYFQTPDGKVNPNRVNLCIKSDKRSVPVLDLLQNKLFDTQ